MTNNTNESKKAKPIYRKLLPNGISAAVFENSYEGRTYRSINLQRSYRKDDKWNRMSMYLDHEHIPFVIEALQSTWQFLNDTPPKSVEEPAEESSTEAETQDVVSEQA